MNIISRSRPVQRRTVAALSALAALLTLASGATPAAEDSITTDRPDFVESGDVVGASRMQLETGLSLERDARDGVQSSISTTPLLVRLGLSDRWEARLEADGMTVASDTVAGRTATTRGFSDISLGAKLHLADNDGLVPGMAMLVHMDVASGSAAFRGNGVRPSLRAVAEWELPAEFSLGVMPGVMFDRNSQRRFTSGILAATLGKQWSGRLRTFVEVAGQQLASQDNGGSVVTYDAGAVYLLGPRLQLDTAVSKGATDNTPGWTYGAGLSVKL